MEQVSKLVCTTLDTINSKFTNKEGIEYLKSYYTASYLRKKYLKTTIEKGFIMLEEEQIIGYGNFSVQKKEIGSLYIKHTLLNKGYGSLLLDHIEKYAAKKHIDEIFVDSTVESHYFYAKRGYMVIKKINIENDEGVDSVLMRKRPSN